MGTAYGLASNSRLRDFTTVNKQIISKEVFKLKPSISSKIVILKDESKVTTYQLPKLSF